MHAPKHISHSAISFLRLVWFRNFPEPPSPGSFSTVSPSQMGDVLRYKEEAYCSTSCGCTAAFPFLQSLEASEAQLYKWGAYCGTNWRCTASIFQTSCTGWGFLNIKNEKSAQRGSFRAGYPADIRGSFARISRPKTSVRALKILEKQAFGRGHPWARRCGCPRP